MKPDVSAPGDQISADGGVTSASAASNTGYTTLHGTSMASPTVAGLAAPTTWTFGDLAAMRFDTRFL